MDPFVACGMRQLADPLYNVLLFFFALDAANWGEKLNFGMQVTSGWLPLFSSCCTINKYCFKCFDLITSCLVILCMTNKYCFLNG